MVLEALGSCGEGGSWEPGPSTLTCPEAHTTLHLQGPPASPSPSSLSSICGMRPSPVTLGSGCDGCQEGSVPRDLFIVLQSLTPVLHGPPFFSPGKPPRLSLHLAPTSLQIQSPALPCCGTAGHVQNPYRWAAPPLNPQPPAPILAGSVDGESETHGEAAGRVCLWFQLKSLGVDIRTPGILPKFVRSERSPSFLR